MKKRQVGVGKWNSSEVKSLANLVMILSVANVRHMTLWSIAKIAKMRYALPVTIMQKMSAKFIRRKPMSDSLILDPYLQRMVDLGMDGADIMHGHLKTLMLEAESNWEAAKNGDPLEEDEYDESDSYHMGYLDALTKVYQLTYAIAFAKGEI
jgi:hypothetical protein